MKNNSILHVFLLLIFITGGLSLEAREPSLTTLKREVAALTKRHESFKIEQNRVIADLKNVVDKSNAVIIALKDELEILKKQKVISSEIIGKIEEQQRNLTDYNDLVQTLVKYGNNPDGMSALHYAIKQGDVSVVNLLIANGASVDSLNGRFTALSRAAIHNQCEIAQTLLALGADVNLIFSQNPSPYNGFDHSNYYPINYAMVSGSTDLITLLIENGALLDKTNPEGHGHLKTPLHTAAKAGNFEAVVSLVLAGADIDGLTPKNGNHLTPLAVAAENLEYAVNPQNLELVKFLVEHGATRRSKNYLENPRTNNIKCPVISGYLQGVKK